ncbi:M16 family metallopeptidase [Candidatus Margulisiibacteriota bacterium]
MSKPNLTEYTLNNGLKIFLVNDPSASLISLRAFVKTGSINEKTFLGSGISHYLEHVVSGGSTSKRTETEYKTAISLIGGAMNAYTTTDHTCYYINTTPKHTPEAISLLYEWLFLCSFNKNEADREKKVIIKEIEKNDANLDRQFYNLCQNNFYKYHPLRLPVIGCLNNFQALTRADLISYYKNKYTPSNMVLIIGGNFKEKNVLQKIKNTFGNIPKYAPPLTTLSFEPPPFSTRFVQKETTTNVTNFSIRFATVDLFSPNLYPLDLLDFILGNGDESLLYKALVEDHKLAYNISCASYTPIETTGYFDISMEINYENLEEAKNKVFEILNNIKKGNFDKNFIERAKKQKLAEDIFSISTIEDKVNRIGQSYVYTYTPDFFERYVESFKKISKEHIIKAAQTYFEFNKAVLTALIPKGTKKTSTLTSGSAGNMSQKPKKIELANGIKVLLYKEESLPRVHAKIFLLGGLRAESTANNGIGHLTAELLGKGSEEYTKDYIQKTIEDRGASLYATLGNNTIFYNLDCLSEDLSDLLPIFFHSFQKPKFQTEDLNEIKRKTYQWIKQRKDDWYSYCKYHFHKAFFGAHPFALSPIGEVESIKTITLKDIYAYHQKLFNTNDMVISIFGKFDEKKVLKIIKWQLGSLKKTAKGHKFLKPMARKLHTKPKSSLLNIPQNVASVFVAFDGESFSNVNEGLKLDLLDSVLSGMNYPAGRLHNILREKGLVYLVHGVNQLGLENGYYFIYALTSKDKAETVKNIIIEEIDKLKTSYINDTEFKQALAQLNFYNKDRISAIDSLAIISSADELYNRGYDHYLKTQKLTQNLSKDDVLQTAQKYLINPQIYIFQNK